MKRKEFLFKGLMVVVMLAMLVLVASPFFMGGEVKGAGFQQSTFIADGSADRATGFAYVQDTGGQTWNSFRTALGGTNQYDAIVRNPVSGQLCGWNYNATKSGYFNTFYRGFMQFDTSSLPDDIDIISAEIRFKALDKASVSGGIKPNICLYHCKGMTAGSVWEKWNFSQVNITEPYRLNRYSDVISYNEFVNGQWMTLYLTQKGINAINKTGTTQFSLRTTYDAEAVQPGWVGVAGSNYFRIYHSGNAGTADDPRLVVTWGEPVVDRDIEVDENAEVGEGEGGEITSIAWESLRCAYADEELGFRVYGAENEGIELQLVSESGEVLASHEDVIRVDGDYNWKTAVRSNFEGFLRVVEVGSDVKSKWGFVHRPPDATQKHNYTYSGYTKYPQYDGNFGDYMVDEQKLMFFNWKTNVQDYELGNFTFKVKYMGLTERYSSTLTNMINNYYENINDDNDPLVAWRYMVMVMSAGEGFDNKDGLIYNLGQPYSWETAGAYQPIINWTGTGELTETVSCYWYVRDVGINMSLDKKDYDLREQMALKVYISNECRGRDMWDLIHIDILNNDGGVVDEYEDNISGENTYVEMIAPYEKGVYTARVYLMGSGVTYEYIQDIVFGAGGAIVPDGEDGGLPTDLGDLWEWLFDSVGGRWVMLIGAMAVATVMLWKHRVAVACVDLGLVAVWIVLGWIEIWLVALLALGAGVIMWSIIRKKAQGGG